MKSKYDLYVNESMYDQYISRKGNNYNGELENGSETFTLLTLRNEKNRILYSRNVNLS